MPGLERVIFGEKQRVGYRESEGIIYHSSSLSLSISLKISPNHKMVDIARVQKELQECNKDKDSSGISVKLKGGNSLTHLVGSIPGPLATPYEGGTFLIDIVIPGNYCFLI